MVFPHPLLSEDAPDELIAHLEAERIAQRPGLYIAIEASNVGEIATTVTGFGFEHPGGQLLLWPEPLPTSDRLPKRVEPGESATTTYRPETIIDVCRENGLAIADLTPFAVTGHGRMRGELAQVAKKALEDRLNPQPSD